MPWHVTMKGWRPPVAIADSEIRNLKSEMGCGLACTEFRSLLPMGRRHSYQENSSLENYLDNPLHCGYPLLIIVQSMSGGRAM